MHAFHLKALRTHPNGEHVRFARGAFHCCRASQLQTELASSHANGRTRRNTANLENVKASRLGARDVHGKNEREKLRSSVRVSASLRVEGSDEEEEVVTELKVAVFSSRAYMEKDINEPLRRAFSDVRFFGARLDKDTAIMADGYDAVNIFVNDTCDKEVVEVLATCGVKMISLRCAGFDRVDVAAANAAGIVVSRVPAYSPYAVAEHAITLMLTLNRQVHKSYNRVREGNFTLDGLVGFDMRHKTVGIIGTGKIGRITARILQGFGARVVAYDRYPSPQAVELGIEYMEMEELLAICDIISLHVPLSRETYHLIDEDTIALMKPSCMVINTSRGALIDTTAMTRALQQRQVGSLAMDVYEKEHALFFQDLASQSDSQAGSSIPDYFDAEYTSLASLPNVIITPHQAFLTQEALSNIGDCAIASLKEFAQGTPLTHEVKP